MASPFISPFLRRSLQLPSSFALGLGAGTLFLASQAPLLRPRLPMSFCDSSMSSSSRANLLSDSFPGSRRDTKVPIFVNGRPNPAAYRQLSVGSALGLVGGVAVSYFSKTLAFMFGLAIFGVQYLANRGINIIPTARLQRYVNDVNWRSLVEDNAAFKLSFGITFALASLGSF